MDFRTKLLAIFALGIFLRILVLGLPIINDNGLWGFHMRAHDSAFVNFLGISHPPLGPWVYDFGGLLFGANAFALRIIPFIFSLAIAAIVTFTAKKFFDERTALFSAAIYLVAFFPFIGSVIIDSDNTILSLLAAVMLFISMKAAREKKKQNAAVLGILFGLALLTKIQAVFFALPVMVIFFIYKNSMREFFSNAISFCLAAFAAISAILALLFLAMRENFLFYVESVFLHLHDYPQTTGFFVVFSQLFPFVVAVTPLFLLPAIFLRKTLKQEKIPLAWILLVGIPYLFFISPAVGPEFVRYFSVLAPAAAILAASAFCKAKLEKAQLAKTAALSTALFALFLLLNDFETEKSFYLIGATFIGQRISHAALLPFLLFSSGLLLWLAFRMISGKQLNKGFFVVFVSLCISFNFLMVSNFFTQQEYGYVLQKALFELKQNGFSRPLYSWDEEIPFYLGFATTQQNFNRERERAFAESIGLKDENSYFDLDAKFEETENSIKTKGGTAVLLNYPKHLVVDRFPPHKKVAELLEKECRVRKRFSMQGAEAVIFDCTKHP